MKTFKVGDRVAVYDNRRWTAHITGIDDVGRVYFGAHPQLKGNPYHPKQCRLLRKKPRRRVWVNYGAIQIGTLTQGFTSKPSGLNYYTEFIEVRNTERSDGSQEKKK